MRTEQSEVLIDGADPSGSVAARLLRKQHRKLPSVEREQFRRYSMGENRLSQRVQYIEAVGLQRYVVAKSSRHAALDELCST